MRGLLYRFPLLDAETNQRICFLNVSPDEVIRSLFYNKNNDSLITVSVYASDNFSSLKCRSTRIEYVHLLTPQPPLSKKKSKGAESQTIWLPVPISFCLLVLHVENCCLFICFRYIRRGKPDAGFALFESESLKWPGFVEFDDVNGKVLTYSAQDR